MWISMFTYLYLPGRFRAEYEQRRQIHVQSNFASTWFSFKVSMITQPQLWMYSIQLRYLPQQKLCWIYVENKAETGSTYTECTLLIYSAYVHVPGAGNSIMVSVFICQAGRPGSSLAWFVCFRKVEIYQHVINLFSPVPTTGSTKAVHV